MVVKTSGKNTLRRHRRYSTWEDNIKIGLYTPASDYRDQGTKFLAKKVSLR
jgi:hypothetical protein